jgi:hypothetical protein
VINVERLAIVSIHLQGMRDTPGRVSFEILQPWLQGNLVVFDIEFNLLDEVTSVGFWDATEIMLSNLEKELEEYVSFKCMVLLLNFYSVVSNVF